MAPLTGDRARPVAAPVTVTGCQGCGACLPTCPARALRPVPGGLRVHAGRCTGCLECLEVCPVDAIHPAPDPPSDPAPDPPSDPATDGRWTRAERLRLGGIVLAVAALHVAGVSLFLDAAHQPYAAAGFAGAGTLAYALGVRHAFDADHIAAIDDTTRLMLLRGRRPVGVGFFFALGHSAVVLLLALLVGLASATVTQQRLDGARAVGATVAVAVATAFLLLVSGLNAAVLAGLVRLRRALRSGAVDEAELDVLLLNRGLVNRVLGRRARGLIRSSWHMAPLGFLFGLGLETASEVTLLSLSASTAAGGRLPVVALLSLPLLFAAGMAAMDTADSLLMARAYAWAQRDPARRLHYNLATTAMTVLIGGFVASVYLAGLIRDHAGASRLGGYAGWLGGYAGIADHFERFGYGIVALFAASWAVAAAVWAVRGRRRRAATLVAATEEAGR